MPLGTPVLMIPCGEDAHQPSPHQYCRMALALGALGTTPLVGEGGGVNEVLLLPPPEALVEPVRTEPEVVAPGRTPGLPKAPAPTVASALLWAQVPPKPSQGGGGVPAFLE